MGLILLVRHGQASWGAADYDVLSSLGEQQAGILGKALADLAPDVVVHGSLKRQRRTAELAAEAAGWGAALVEDDDWNEIDHLAVPGLEPEPAGGEPDSEQFDRWFAAATERWTGGEHDADYPESFAAFGNRVRAALERAAEAGTAVVFSSGGPISVSAAALLGGEADATRLAYSRFAPVIMNSSVTRIVSGRRGLTLISFNEHSHLDGDSLTYR